MNVPQKEKKKRKSPIKDWRKARKKFPIKDRKEAKEKTYRKVIGPDNV